MKVSLRKDVYCLHVVADSDCAGAFDVTVSPVPGGGAGPANPCQGGAQGLPHEIVGYGRSARQV